MKLILGVCAAILISVVVGYASITAAENAVNQSHSSQRESQQTAEKFAKFHDAICALMAQQAKSGKSFYQLLHTLEERALEREGVDKAAGAFNAAAADADSARLYEAVLASSQQGQSGGAAASLCK